MKICRRPKPVYLSSEPELSYGVIWSKTGNRYSINRRPTAVLSLTVIFLLFTAFNTSNLNHSTVDSVQFFSVVGLCYVGNNKISVFGLELLEWSPTILVRLANRCINTLSDVHHDLIRKKKDSTNEPIKECWSR